MTARPSLAGSRSHSHRRLYSVDDTEQHASFAPLQSIAKKPGDLLDAAAQQAFHEKTWVWVPDAQKGYVSSWIMKEEGQQAECMGIDDKIRLIHRDDLSKQNPPKFDQVEDMAALTHLNEASVVHNMETRFKHDRIYTYSGPFLVAVNPYRNLDAYYSTAAINQFMNRRREENPPHIFAIAQQAWAQMISERESQSILVTGESGAGKTENTKKVIQFLTAIAADSSNILPSSGSAETLADSGTLSRANSLSVTKNQPKKLGKLEHQILQANPILEAFGNAQTVRNNNSSRFGKFVRIEFSASGAIAGAFIDWYLLEKSRVTSRSEHERSFHVFYQLLQGAPTQLKKDLLLMGGADQYRYLNISSHQVQGIDDTAEWTVLQRALDVVGFSKQEQFNIFKIVATILHLGNLQISGRDRALIDNAAELEKAAHLLGLPIKEFSSALLQPKTKAGREWVTQARSRAQVVDEIAAVCKTLYEKTFGFLVDRINQALERPTVKSTFIGVLDIAGFEIFERNSFEQLCINYTNEKLQQFFNHHMFVLEQEEYEREEIGWQFENFGLDLQPTIDLIEASQPVGVLATLDEECIMPKASDETFTDKLKQAYLGAGSARKANPKFSANLYDKLKFSIQHYAGKVDYETQDWLIKNKDPLNENLGSVLSASTDTFVASLFADFGESTNPQRRQVVKRGAFRTVGQRHKEQLHALMNQLQATSPHFVRCIVPNSNKRPSQIDTLLVLDQLRCNGVLEGIRIARLGYPNRLPFVEFRHRYELLTPDILPKGYVDGRVACQKMLATLKLDTSEYKVGRTKAFFKAGVLADLEERRDELLYGIFANIQAACRRHVARRNLLRILNRAMAARTIQRNARIYLELRQWPWWNLYTRVRPLLAATRADDDLKRKDAELVLAKEREIREQQERERLAKLQEQAAAERKALEATLQQERKSREEQEALLHRFTDREKVLRENIESAEADIDQLLATNAQQEQAIQRLQAEHSSLSDNFAKATSQLNLLEKSADKWQSADQAMQNLKAQHMDQVKTHEQQKKNLENQLQHAALAKQAADANLSSLQDQARSEIARLRADMAAAIQRSDDAVSKLKKAESERNAVQAQVTDLSQATQDYDSIIKQKEAASLQHLETIAILRKQQTEDRQQLRSLSGELASVQSDVSSHQSARQSAEERENKVQARMSALEATLAAKVSEDTMRQDAAKQLERQLASLKEENASLSSKLLTSTSGHEKEVASLRNQITEMDRQSATMQRSNSTSRKQVEALQIRNGEVELALQSAEKRLASSDNEMQALRGRGIELDAAVLDLRGKLNEAARNADSARLRFEKAERSAEEAEYAKAAAIISHQQANTALETANTMRERAEANNVAISRERDDLKRNLLRQERACVDLQARLENLDKELGHSRTLEHRTTIEHVHTLERAMKVQARELAQKQNELGEAQSTIQVLNKARNRIQQELEDVSVNTRLDTTVQRTQADALSKSEKAAHEASVKLDRERRAREAADSTVAKIKSDLRNLQAEMQAQSQRVERAESSKQALENELRSLAQRPVSPQYQTFGNVAPSSGRKLVEQMTRTASDLSGHTSGRVNGIVNKHGAARGSSVDLSSSTSRATQSAEIQLLMIDKAISDKVRKGLESQIQDLRDLFRDGSTDRMPAQDVQRRLDRETARLQDLLREEARARQEAETARLQGSDALHAYHTKIKASLDDRFTNLESSRNALQAVERQLTTDNEVLNRQLIDARREIQARATATASVESQLDSLKADHRDALNELASLHAQLQSFDAQQSNDELQRHIYAIQQEADKFRGLYEDAALREEKAVKEQTYSSMAKAEAEKMKSEALEDRDEAYERARQAEARFRELEAHQGDNASRLVVASLERDCTRLVEDLEIERRQRIAIENDSEKKCNALHTSYQKQLDGLTTECNQKQDMLARTRAEAIRLQSTLEELQEQYNNESYSSAAWTQEKSALTDNWMRAKRAFDEAVQRQSELQSKNVELVQENRDLMLRSEEARAESQRILQSKKALEQQLQASTTMRNADSSPMLHAINLERDDLRKELEAARTSLAMAQAKYGSAEKFANEQKRNAQREREEGGKLSNENNDLHRQVKELQARLANYDARSVAASPRPQANRNADARIEELTRELREERKLRANVAETSQIRDFELKDMMARLADAEQIRNRLKQDREMEFNANLMLRKEVADARNAETLAKQEAASATRDRESTARDADRVISTLRSENDSLRKRVELGRSSTIASLTQRGAFAPTANREVPIKRPR